MASGTRSTLRLKTLTSIRLCTVEHDRRLRRRAGRNIGADGARSNCHLRPTAAGRGREASATVSAPAAGVSGSPVELQTPGGRTS